MNWEGNREAFKYEQEILAISLSTVDKKADPSVIQSANKQTQQDKQDSTGQCHFTYTIIAFLNVSRLLLLLLFLCLAHDALTQYSQLLLHLI